MLAFLALALTGLLAAGPLAPSAMGKTKPKPKPKPDLIVTQARKFDVYAIKGKSDTFSYRYVITNVKKKGHDAAAGRSRTGVRFVPANSRNRNPAPYPVGDRLAPGLRPGHSHTDAHSEILLTDFFPLGSYKVLVCADFKQNVKERDEENNCKRVGNFYVIQESWRGSVNGVGPADSAAKAEKWKTLGAHLDFAKHVGGGRFNYDFSGTVEWNDSGVTTGGCTASGHGEKTFDHVPGLVLDYNRGIYGGNVHIDRFYT